MSIGAYPDLPHVYTIHVRFKIIKGEVHYQPSVSGGGIASLVIRAEELHDIK